MTSWLIGLWVRKSLFLLLPIIISSRLWWLCGRRRIATGGPLGNRRRWLLWRLLLMLRLGTSDWRRRLSSRHGLSRYG
uniref:Putative secreted peptide n=1 Tax=Anopheles braziliensis TaxID=58242 RepID=A0A2M3ZPV7_9DIPT